MKVALHVFVIAALLAGCGMGAQVDSGRDTANRFLELMAQGKHQQAHELCAGGTVSLEELKDWSADPGNASLLAGYKGVDWASGGELKTDNSPSTMRLPPSKLTGRTDVTVQFFFRWDDNAWKIIAWAIESGK
jgi:hypothetical protein